ncbi:restriction endonuclease subunit S [Virgibacillus sp.]|uniref:restriction endonuclease subunit S n=1 Tax=Virgibacillus sp. TaxID=1872700 RepID=UPI001803B9A1|nr:restriction endonuclease subunit S [Virgibacillus sp.]NWO14612.1 restriction endonuclease subunit S [Virgibacillus sp.]
MEQKKRVPKRRFKGFVDEWEERILEDLGRFGKTYSYSRAKEGVGDYYHIHYGDIHKRYDGVIKKTTKIPSLKVEGNYETLNNGDIVLADASEDYMDLGKTVVIEEANKRKIIAGLHTFKFTPNEYLNSLFYLYYSQSSLFKKFSYKTGTGISVFGISKENINKMKLKIPSYLEQQKIGDFFKKLDDMITIQQRKLEKTKALKSAYLAEMFPAEGERLPKRRFAGFTGEWRVKKIGKLMNVTSVKRIHQSDWREEGVRFLRARDIVAYSKNEQPTDLLYISKEKYKEYTRLSGKVSKGDLLVTGVGTIGVPFLIENENQIYFKDGNIIWFKNHKKIDGYFLYYSFKTKVIQNYIHNIAGIGTVGTYTIENGKQTPIYLPSLNEQQKIGDFFKKLDDMITNHHRKLEKLQALKQAYLHEMFV